LGTGDAFHSIHPLTHISTTQIVKFFHCFLDISMDMWEQYISMSHTIIALNNNS
jgi:hypothetical protein